MPSSRASRSLARRPVIAISMGDPSGVGPEVALRALQQRDLKRSMSPLLVGDRGVFRDAARRLGLPLDLDHPGRGPSLIEVSALASADRRPGKPTRAGAEAAYRAILEAVAAVQAGRASAMTTAPVSKSAIQALGVSFPGHTEVIAKLAGDAEVRMMMAGATLRVVLVTTHIRLLDVPARLTREIVLETARIADAALRRAFGIRRPRLALAGLNPHAGESGAFGDEEIRILEPAVAAAGKAGLRLEGPFPPDTVFVRAREGVFDAVLALYHDQGLIPFKLLHFHDGVNVTLGLPFPRTSPDHGTAYDIAGKGKADPSSMAAALRLAASMAASPVSHATPGRNG